MKEINVRLNLQDLRRFFLVVIGSVIMALNLNSFVHFGELIPGGFTGISLLFQRLGITFFNIEIPFSVINIPLNIIPAAICFKYIGKKFTILSCISIVLVGVIVDMIPYNTITVDPLLTSIFGGIINGIAISLCLKGDATTGGTDFISILLSDKYGIDTWNYVLLGNAFVLCIAGAVYGWDKALYSIIYQFATTEILHVLYRRYQKNTLFIITEKPEKVYQQIKDATNHGATLFKGTGFYEKKERCMVYSVVSSDEIGIVISKIREIDEKAFVDVIRSERVTGRFVQRPLS